MKKLTSKLVLEEDKTHALLNDVSNCRFPVSIYSPPPQKKNPMESENPNSNAHLQTVLVAF